MTQVLITNGRVLTQNDDRDVIDPGAVAVAGDRIVAVGPAKKLDSDFDPDTVIDAEGGAIIPGLINSHVHVSDILLRGAGSQDRGLYDWLLNVKMPGTLAMEPADHALAARLYCAESIQAGTTTFVEKRVPESVADRFTELFCEGVAALKIGDPLDPDTQIGPMARMNLRDELHDQVERSVSAGAVPALGGEPLDSPGCYYAPTVLTHVTPEHPAFREELFGPVASVIRARDAGHAIELANDSEFGLGAALWTADLDRAREMSRAIDAGAVFINGMVASDARLPFGGIKKSGYGRELGALGIREFTNIKTIWIGPKTE